MIRGYIFIILLFSCSVIGASINLGDIPGLGEIKDEIFFQLLLELPDTLRYLFKIGDESVSPFLHVDPATRLMFHNSLGRGGCGEVLQTVDIESGEILATKIISLDRSDPYSSPEENTIETIIFLKGAITETVALQKCGGHPGIPRFHSAILYNSNIYVTEELKEGAIISSIPQIKGNIQHIKKVAWMLLDILAHLERCGIVHRDIAARNVMAVYNEDTDSVEDVFLLDFDISAPVGAKILSFNEIGNFEAPPELGAVLGSGSSGCLHGSPAYDIFLLSSMLYNLVTGRQYVDTQGMKIIKATDPDLHGMLLLMRNEDPDQRPSACTLRQHPFFIDLEDPVVEVDTLSTEGIVAGVRSLMMESVISGELALQELEHAHKARIDAVYARKRTHRSSLGSIMGSSRHSESSGPDDVLVLDLEFHEGAVPRSELLSSTPSVQVDSSPGFVASLLSIKTPPFLNVSDSDLKDQSD